MKKLSILLLFPLLLAIQCEDDENSGFETTYFIENNANLDLFYLTPDNRFVDLPRESTISLASDLNSDTSPIPPSDSFIFSEIKLYKIENDNFILIYSQNPIDNALWEFNEPVMNRFEYTLIISENTIN